MCPIGFLMLGSTLQDLPSDSPAARRPACRRQASLRTGSHQRTILACTRPVLVGHAVELATAQPPPTTTVRSKPTPPLAHHRLHQLRAPGSQLRQTTSRSWTQRATTPTPAIPAIWLPARAALQDLTSAGHSARGNAQTPDAGQRTPGRSDARTGHWTPVPWTGKRGHWSLAPDTGH